MAPYPSRNIYVNTPLYTTAFSDQSIKNIFKCVNPEVLGNDDHSLNIMVWRY